MTRRKRTLGDRRAAGPAPRVRVAGRLSCTEDTLEESLAVARREAAAQLLRALGARARGAVHWRWYKTAAAREGALDALAETGYWSPEDLQTARDWFVEHPKGALVVALCDAVMPDEPEIAT